MRLKSLFIYLVSSRIYQNQIVQCPTNKAILRKVKLWLDTNNRFVYDGFFHPFTTFSGFKIVYGNSFWIDFCFERGANVSQLWINFHVVFCVMFPTSQMGIWGTESSHLQLVWVFSAALCLKWFQCIFLQMWPKLSPWSRGDRD